MSRIYDVVFHYIWNAYYEHYDLTHDLPFFFCEGSINHIQSISKGILHLGELNIINVIGSVYLIVLLELRA